MKIIPLCPSVHQSLVSVPTCWIYSAMNSAGKFFESIIFKRDDRTVNYKSSQPLSSSDRRPRKSELTGHAAVSFYLSPR